MFDGRIIIAADAPDALTEICGISVLERLLRILQRLGIRRATLVSATAKPIRAHLSRPSWARAGIAVELQSLGPELLTPAAIGDRGTCLVLCAAYCDARLLKSLIEQDQTTALTDSAPPAAVRPLLLSHPPRPIAALLHRSWLAHAARDQPLFEQLAVAAERKEIALLDAATQASYVAGLRREIRPVWFPPPSPENIPIAEQVVLDTAQNGTLDLPAIVHAPIESWIVARLCRTSITPNQITFFTAAVSAVVVVLFASGRIIPGTLLALAIGILDGLDGKQARVKVETTELGKREHFLDYVLELSWWSALAYHFTAPGQLQNAYALLAMLVGADIVDRVAKKQAKHLTGRNLDDVAPIDRFVRLIGGRRNIYIWIFATGLVLGAPGKAFIALCCWGALTAAVHSWRTLRLSRQLRAARSKGAAH